MDTEPLETLAQDGQQSLAVFEQAQSRIPEIEVASDPPGVMVAIGGDGLVQKITVLHGWSDQTTADGLAGHIVATVARANGERVTRWLTLAEEMSREPTPTAGAMRAAGPSVGGRGTGRALEGVQREIREAGGLGAIFDELLADLISAGGTEHRGSGSGDRVTARCSMSGDLTGLDIALPWLGEASPTEIGAEVTRAVMAGQRSGLEAPRFEDLVSQSRLGALQRRLTSAPTTECE